eukprot:1143951-Pelagomonas_calceolata.AAC.5
MATFLVHQAPCHTVRSGVSLRGMAQPLCFVASQAVILIPCKPCAPPYREVAGEPEGNSLHVLQHARALIVHKDELCMGHAAGVLCDEHLEGCAAAQQQHAAQQACGQSACVQHTQCHGLCVLGWRPAANGAAAVLQFVQCSLAESIHLPQQGGMQAQVPDKGFQASAFPSIFQGMGPEAPGSFTAVSIIMGHEPGAQGRRTARCIESFHPLLLIDPCLPTPHSVVLWHSAHALQGRPRRAIYATCACSKTDIVPQICLLACLLDSWRKIASTPNQGTSITQPPVLPFSFFPSLPVHRADALAAHHYLCSMLNCFTHHSPCSVFAMVFAHCSSSSPSSREGSPSYSSSSCTCCSSPEYSQPPSNNSKDAIASLPIINKDALVTSACRPTVLSFHQLQTEPSKCVTGHMCSSSSV